MNNKKNIWYKYAAIMGIFNSSIDSYLDDDISSCEFINNNIVQNALLDMMIGILEYTNNPTDIKENELHEKYLQHLKEMNEEEANYFKNYLENLINNMGTKSDEVEFQRKRR